MPSAVLWIFRSVADKAEQDSNTVNAPVGSSWKGHTEAFAVARRWYLTYLPAYFSHQVLEGCRQRATAKTLV